MKALAGKLTDANKPCRPYKPVKQEGAVYKHDLTYKRLLGLTGWQRLDPQIRRRFSVRPTTTSEIQYSGVMQVLKFSFFGFLFAHFCRTFGHPLVTRSGRNVPVIVHLLDDLSNNGIAWQRNYHFKHETQTVASTKLINNEGDLEELIGHGFFMKLNVFEKDGNLHFESERYQFRFGQYKITIPDLLTPGKTLVSHEQIQGNRFRFVLSVTHPILGLTIFQSGEFE